MTEVTVTISRHLVTVKTGPWYVTEEKKLASE